MSTTYLEDWEFYMSDSTVDCYNCVTQSQFSAWVYDWTQYTDGMSDYMLAVNNIQYGTVYLISLLAMVAALQAILLIVVGVHLWRLR